MSVVHENLQRSNGSVGTWYLRLPDGASYGPVPLPSLIEWAGQNRMPPGSSVSPNGQKWTPAEAMPELKLDWMAEMADGLSYGPFHVLAVPHLFNNGTINTESRIINRHTGKALNVRDILKSADPQSGSLPEVRTVMLPIANREKKWEERFQEEHRTRLLHEAQLQQTIDSLRSGTHPSGPAASVEPQEGDKDPVELEVLQQKARVAEQQNRQTLEQHQNDIRTLRLQLANAEKDLAEQRKRTESTGKQSSAAEDRLRAQMEQGRQSLQVAQANLEAARKELADERRALEGTRRQAQAREQELARQIEESRREAENRATQLEKAGRDLQSLESGRSEITNRGREEENRLKARLEQLTKELQVSGRDLSELRKRTQMLEQENAQKEMRLQGQAAEHHKKADAALAELERTKKELESQRALQAEAQKVAVEREASLKRESTFARSAMIKAEHELASYRKQQEALREETEQKDLAVRQKMEQREGLLKEANARIDQLQQEAGRKTDGLKQLEVKEHDVEAELEATRARLREMRTQMEPLKDQLVERSAAIEKARADFHQLKAESEDASRRLAADLEEARTEITMLRESAGAISEEMSGLRAKERSLEEALGSARAETKKVRDELAAVHSHADSELERLRAGMESALAEQDRLEGELAAAQQREQSLSGTVQELMGRYDSDTAGLQSKIRELTQAVTEAQAQTETFKEMHSDETLRFESELQRLMAAIDEARAGQEQMQQQASLAEGREVATAAELTELKHRHETAEAELARLRVERDELRHAFEAGEMKSRTEAGKAESERVALLAELNALREAESGRVKELTELRAQVQSATADYRQKQSAQELKVALLEKTAREGAERVSAAEAKLAAGQKQADAALKQKQAELAALSKTLAAAEEALQKKDRELELARQKEEEEKTLFSGLQTAEARKEEQLSHEIKVLRDENGWLHQQLKEEEARRLHAVEESGVGCASLEKQVEALAEKMKVAEYSLTAARAEQEQIEAAAAKEIATLRGRLEETEKAAHDVEARLTDEERKEHELEARLTDEERKEHELEERIHRREDELGQRVVELERVAGDSVKLVEGLEVQLASRNGEFDDMTKKAQAATQEVEKVRNELDKLRKQHEALQELLKKQDKGVPLQVGPREVDLEESEGGRWGLGVAAILAILLTGGVMFWAGTRQGRNSAEVRALRVALASARAEAVKPAAPPVTKAEQPSPRPKGPSWPAISVAGAEVRASDKECRIVFEQGVFSSRSNITGDGMSLLEEVAAQVKGSLKDFNLIVEGHTDPSPSSSDPATDANTRLGQARANAVVDVLKKRFDLPAAALSATSKGEEDPPFPNTDEASRRKNRTVVLVLVPKP